MRSSVKELGDCVPFMLNGRSVTAIGGETILQTAKRNGVDIPHLCYMDGMRPDGNCRACIVEVKGERVLAPSCCRYPTPGMEVASDSARAMHSQSMVLELLLSDMPTATYKPDSELNFWVDKMQVGKARFAPRESPAADFSHPAIAVNLDACIQCTRCVRACREVQVPTTSSATLSAVAVRRSCSTWATRWGKAAASPVAHACKLVLQARSASPG